MKLQNPADIDKIINERKERLIKIKSTFQPVPLFVGPSENNTYSSYVMLDVVEGIRYDVQSVSDAVDTTFKSIYCFDVQYPLESAHIFHFLEQALYKITENSKKNSIGMNQLLNSIGL